MKVTQSTFVFPLIVSALYLTACSSSSSPAPTPAEDSVIPPTTDGGPLDTDTVNPSTETPDTSNPGIPVVIPGGSGTPLSGSVSKVGMLSFSYQEFGDETDINGQFFQFNAQVTPAQLQAGLDSNVNVTDSCAEEELQFGGGTNFEDIDIESLIPDLSDLPATLNAGEVITVTSPAGTLASLVPEVLFGFTIYQSPGAVEVPGGIVSGTTVNIPGAANGFPAFPNVAVPAAGPMGVVLEGNAASGFSLSWNPSAEANSSMFITLIALDQGATTLSAVTYIKCSLLDDGAHSVASTLLPASDSVILTGGSADRSSSIVVQQGNALLMVESTSSSSIAAPTN